MVERSQKIRERYFALLMRGLFVFGFVLVLVGLLVNATFFERFISYDGTLEEATKQLILYVQMVVVSVGIVLCIVGRSLVNVSLAMKELVINGSLFLLSAMAVLLLLEVSLRLMMPSTAFSVVGTDPAVFETSDIIPWTLKPNASDRFVALDFDTIVSINSLGLRDKERHIKKDEGVYRILVVGDSFTYGFGVNNNESYPAVLERELKENIPNKKFEVWNAGFAAGYTEDTFYLFLREKGISFNPDLMLVGVYVENDVLDFLKNKYVYDTNRQMVKITSDFYCVENNRLRRGCRAEKKSGAGMLKVHAQRFLLGTSLLYAGVAEKVNNAAAADNNPIFEKQYSAQVEENFKKFYFFVSETKKLADMHKIKMGLIILPGKSSINELWEKYHEKNPDADRDKPRRLILEYCKKNKVVCLDVWPYFINATDAKTAYFEHDAHWSREGNARGGKIIADLLIKNKLII